MNLPNLIVIGAQKCATRSLHYYLNLHPQITMSEEKELNFFIQERNWHKGIEWYQSNFSDTPKIQGESSPGYTNYPFWDGVTERMSATVPEAKLIYLVRDPIERMISHYVHYYADRKEDRQVSEAFTELEFNIYACRSKYYMQIEQYLKHFPQANILIIATEDLNINRRQTLQKIFHFLDVDESFHSNKFSLIWHKSKYKRRKTRLGLRLEGSPIRKAIQLLPFEMRGAAEKLLYLPFSRKVERPVLNERLRETIADFLKDDINHLREYAGCDFESWCL